LRDVPKYVEFEVGKLHQVPRIDAPSAIRVDCEPPPNLSKASVTNTENHVKTTTFCIYADR